VCATYLALFFMGPNDKLDRCCGAYLRSALNISSRAKVKRISDREVEREASRLLLRIGDLCINRHKHKRLVKCISLNGAALNVICYFISRESVYFANIIKRIVKHTRYASI
jgi:hypothetical protein